MNSSRPRPRWSEKAQSNADSASAACSTSTTEQPRSPVGLVFAHDGVGRRQVLQLLRRYECVASAVLPVELRSALRRRVTDGTLEAARVPEILKRFSADRAYWTVVGVGTEVLDAAERLVAVHPLRTLDAIHVASAQVFAAGVSVADLMFVSADKRQTEAAAVIGLATRYIA